MNKSFSYSSFRRLTFCLMVLLTLIFAIFLFTIIHFQVDDYKEKTYRQQRYIQSILNADETFSKFQQNMPSLMAITQRTEINTELINDLYFQIITLKKQLEKTQSIQKEISQFNTFDINELHKYTTLIKSSIAVILSTQSIHNQSDAITQRNEAIHELLTQSQILERTLNQMLSQEWGQNNFWASQSDYVINTILPTVVIYILAMTIFAIIASFGMSEALAKQLRQLSNGTRKISKGDLTFRFPENNRKDELDAIMYDFNFMAEKLEQQTKLLQQTNHQLSLTAENLREANKHKDRFLANMSHELRTPLNAIMGFSELILARAENLSPEKNKHYAERILKAAEHLLELISDLLEVAKLDAGIQTINFTCFNLNGCINNTISMMLPLADQKGIELKTESENQDLPIIADRRFICQVLINLINNALKFTHHGYISIKTVDADPFWQIEIADTGIGIAKEEQEKIFQDFHRVESSLTVNFEGVGLGLTLSRRLIHLHGGTLKVISELGKGSTFIIQIPKIQNIKEENTASFDSPSNNGEEQ